MDALDLTSLTMIYQLVLQQVDGENNILETIPNGLSIALPQGVSGKTVHSIADGAVDYPLPILQGDFTDFVVLYANQALTYKLDNISATPIRMRAGGMHMIDSDSIQGVFVSNASGHKATLLFVQARRQVIP